MYLCRQLINFFLVFMICISSFLHSRLSSYPFISGDSFRSVADFIYDEDIHKFNPRRVKRGDVVFIKIDYVDGFFRWIHPRIKHPYVIITHNGDKAITNKYARLLNDPKVLAWYGQNIEGIEHPKLKAIPIGLANRYLKHGSLDIIRRYFKNRESSKRDKLLYLNINRGTNKKVRNYVCNLLLDQPFTVSRCGVSFQQYLNDLTQSNFVASPRGNGLDCHRTWESLYMGAIPIVESSSLDYIYKTLPVVIVDDWSLITEEFLREKLNYIHKHKYDCSMLYMDYWIKEIRKYKQH
ncbi:MAG: hypothetical protein S4CHLAM20_00630 [Chlamydiia bacterium]|nr:hypothetical protein [Chlamydiia bacterium]